MQGACRHRCACRERSCSERSITVQRDTLFWPRTQRGAPLETQHCSRSATCTRTWPTRAMAAAARAFAVNATAPLCVLASGACLPHTGFSHHQGGLVEWPAGHAVVQIRSRCTNGGGQAGRAKGRAGRTIAQLMAFQYGLPVASANAQKSPMLVTLQASPLELQGLLGDWGAGQATKRGDASQLNPRRSPARLRARREVSRQSAEGPQGSPHHSITELTCIAHVGSDNAFAGSSCATVKSVGSHSAARGARQRHEAQPAGARASCAEKGREGRRPSGLENGDVLDVMTEPLHIVAGRRAQQEPSGRAHSATRARAASRSNDAPSSAGRGAVS